MHAPVTLTVAVSDEIACGGIVGVSTAEVTGTRSGDPPASATAAEGFAQFDMVDDVSDHRFITRTEPHQNPRCALSSDVPT